MTSTVGALSGVNDGALELTGLIRFIGATPDATPLPCAGRAAPNASLLLLSALAQATALGVLVQPENAATIVGSWARDLGQERRTSTSDVRSAVVVHEVLRPPSVLHQAHVAATRTKAYAIFDSLLGEDSPSVSGEEHFAAFLTDPESKHRDALLACLADREVELESGPLMTVIAQLLTATDARTRRMAALALASSGATGEAELGRGLDALSVEWAEDIRATLRYSAA